MIIKQKRRVKLWIKDYELIKSIGKEHKEGCYFYNEVQDMSAHIPTCEYYHKFGYCPCDKCDKYFSKSDVYKLVKERVGNNDN